MRVSAIEGLPLIDPRTAKKVGTVCDVVIDGESHRLHAFDIETAGGAARRRVSANAVARVGNSAVMLKPADLSDTPDQAVAPDRCIDLERLNSLEVLGDDGNRLGRLGDAFIDQDTLAIECYEMAAPGWRRSLKATVQIEPNTILSCSRDVLLVRTLRGEHRQEALHDDIPREETPRQEAPREEQRTDGAATTDTVERPFTPRQVPRPMQAVPQEARRRDAA